MLCRLVSYSSNSPSLISLADALNVFQFLAFLLVKVQNESYVTCQLFKTYFKLGTVNLCRSVMRQVLRLLAYLTLRSFQEETRSCVLEVRCVPCLGKAELELQVVYQRLMKKIYIIQKLSDPARAHQLKLEVECIMTILIYKSLVKVYLAHKSKVVVLSKQHPFPKLNGKPVGS
ncbi:Uncharacterized protein Rs2_03216 [Raphanus sativus]|nr:Uncharacterized protein Rs2_03216 [Raphanus sativus]